MPAARSIEKRRCHSWLLLGEALEVQARAVVEEVLPRALGAALAEALQLPAQVLGAVGVDVGHDLGLPRPRGLREEVHERVRVGGDEVQRAVGEALLVHGGADRAHPAPGDPRVADLAAAEHADAQVQAAVVDLVEEVAQRAVPCVAHADPVVLGAAVGLGARLRIGIAAVAGTPARAQRGVQLVPLDLVGDQRRDQVVEVRRRREQHGQRAGPVVEPAPAAGGGLDGVPLLDAAEPGAAEDDRLLAHHDHRRLPDVGREAAHRVHEGAEVRLAVGGERVQAGVHGRVRGLQHAQVRLARGAQQRRVGAVVELDLVGGQPGSLAQRSAWLDVGDAQAGDGHAPARYQ